MLRNSENKTGFTHAWASCNDDQVRLLEPARFRVEITEAARHAGNNRLILVDRFDLIPRVLQDVLEHYEVLRDAAFGDVENHALRRVERLTRWRAVVET